MNEFFQHYGIFLPPTLFMLCFGTLFYSLFYGMREAAESYSQVYAQDAARELEGLFLFIPARRIVDMARIAGLTTFLIFFLISADFTTGGGIIRGMVVGILMGILVLFAPSGIVKVLRKRRLQRFNQQLVEALGSMSNALRAGFSVQQAFESIVKEGQNPIAQEFGVFIQQTRVGVRFEDALVNLEERVNSEDLTLMIRAIEIARQTGGNLTEVFDRIAETIRERSRIEGRIRALTAMGRLQGIVVGLIPIFLLFVMTTLDPKMMMNFFASPIGVGLLIAVVFLEIIGFYVITKIVNIRV